MTKSTITRERLEWLSQISCRDDIEDIGGDEIRELASMALAVMDSEPVALQPELAKVIYHFRDWNEGFPVERFKADYVISWMLANYPPAPPAPVVSADLLHTAASAIEDLLTTKDRTGAGVWFDLPFRLRSAANAQPAPVVPEEKPIPNTLSMYAVDAVAAIAEVKGWNACRAAMLQVSPVCTCPSGDGSLRWPCPVHPGNSPVIPDTRIPVCERCGDEGWVVGEMGITRCVCSQDSNSPQPPGSEPATVPGKWIPVSERIPDNTEPVLCIEKRADFGTYGQPFVCWHDGGGWVGKTNYRPIVTHWMPLPAAPQEVKGE
ncbi:DUF551 domain-containing protein [Klebsiella pneumoniae]|uniref:DUF551 domain-containing protein n=1 Tax=Klebsiella pneumoniae TaxID=573 RepID=UPI0027BA7BA3|nr:DUF551 domain-containing protein [Klebsiella pneumoniae]WLX72955.1 DUF551 domain-containing protein [Klebsiella pneumoniae]